MKRTLVMLTALLLFASPFVPVKGETLWAVLEEGYWAENQFGPYIGDLVANMGQQSWVRLQDSVYVNRSSGKQTEKIGTIEDGARLPCVGLMVDSG